MAEEKEYYNCDFHIHSCLSPCADILMTPGNIIEKALKKGLDIIAITDHNSAGNVEVSLELARRTELIVIPGMEVASIEEIHLLCLFDELEQVLSWQERVYWSLPDRENDEEFFGYQLLTDINDEYIAKEKRLLAAATDMSVNDIVKEVKNLGGIVIPSHIDRKYNSIISNLGFVPPELDFQVLEVSRNGDIEKLKEQYGFLENYSMIYNSDSHYLKDIDIMSRLKLDNKKIQSLESAVLKTGK
ncbi:MAG: PHP domain-containing protein [Halanaerobiales bacterium]